MLDICKFGDPILCEKCDEVKEFGDELAILADSMFDTLEESDGVGLACPQIGVKYRMFVVSIPDEKIRTVMVNPQITETSNETGLYNEGCLSFPGVYRDVRRPLEITVFYQGVDGSRHNTRASGLFARVIQHEYDHLEGKMFIDRLSDEERTAAIALYNKKSRGRRRFSGRR